MLEHVLISTCAIVALELVDTCSHVGEFTRNVLRRPGAGLAQHGLDLREGVSGVGLPAAFAGRHGEQSQGKPQAGRPRTATMCAAIGAGWHVESVPKTAGANGLLSYAARSGSVRA